MVPLQPRICCFTASFLWECLKYCGDSIQICCGIVWEDCAEQRQPNLMQSLQETTELHPAWREPAAFVGKGALGRTNSWWDWLRGAGLSDTIDAPEHIPWKNLRLRAGTPHPENLQDLATKTAYKHQSCDNLCWFPPCTNPTRLHSQAWQDVAASKSHLKKKKRPEVSSVSQKVNPGPSPSNCHRIPTLPWERGTGLVGGAGMETSSVWTEGKIPSYWDAPRHHCQYKHHSLELMLAQLF